VGDRANVCVVMDHEGGYSGSVYFYTHWHGAELPRLVQRALGRRQRWDDPAYLARIIFSEMIRDDVGGETGFGISLEVQDNEYPLLVVDARRNNMQVHILPASREGTMPGDVPDFQDHEKYPCWSFGEFVAVTTKDLVQAWASVPVRDVRE